MQEQLIRSISQENYSSGDEVYEAVEESVLKEGMAVYITAEEKHYLVKSVYNSIKGLDVLQDIVDNPDITEIMVNGPENIFVEKDGKITKYPGHFTSMQKLEDVVQQIVARVNRMVNESNPIVDVRLLDGSRVNIVLPPVSLNGPVITIRKFPKTPMTMDKLINIGSVSEEVANFLNILVVAKYNIFISGGTGSGKTTFLNVLSNYIPSDERIITIEDSAELQIRGVPNLVKLEVRNANVEGKNAVTIRDLLKSALRMRPERIVVGEVRGGEALDMLQAMNTGHDGSLSTGHANSTKDMLSRLETMVLQGAAGLPLEAIRQQIASAIDIIIHLSRLRDKSRKTMEICEVTGYENGEIILNPLYVFEETEKSTIQKVDGILKRTNNKLVHDFKLKLSGIYEEI